MPRHDELKTKYTDPRLEHMTAKQEETLKLLKAKFIKLSIYGTVHCATRRKLYLIERNGIISMSAKAYGKWI